LSRFSQDSIKKKCDQYELTNSQPVFYYDFKSITELETTVINIKPDFVVIDSLQSMEKYYNRTLNVTMNTLKTLSHKYNFALVVIGELRKDKISYLGSASIGHIADVLIRIEESRNDEIILSTPEKNRDTDDKTSRCFFRRTYKGLVEILESETGMWRRHSSNEKMGLVTFISENTVDHIADEITAAEIPDTKKPSLKIVGMNSDKAKGILAVLQNNFIEICSEYILRANYSTKLSISADLACFISVLSLLFKKPIPVDTVFIGGVDHQGFLLPVEGMVRRVKRAKALGYERIIGPKANQSVHAIWEEAETLKEVWKKMYE